MKIFETNLKYFATLGITRHQAMQRQPFNTENVLQFFNHCLCVSLCIGNLLCEANSFREYTDSIYFISSAISVAAMFLQFVWNMKFFFEFIDGLKKCIKES